MSNLNRDTIQGYLTIFKDYQPMHPDLQAQVDDLGRRMYALADAHSDPMAFFQAFSQSGLQEEYSALMGKVVMASMGTVAADGTVKTDYSDTPAPEVFSVRQYLEQYRIPYEEVKKAGYRKRGERAYEELLALADETEDMQEAQLQIEERRLLWKIVKEDSLDIFQPILEAMDPLQAESLPLEKHVEVYLESDGDEALTYGLELAENEKALLVGRAMSRVQLTVLLAGILMDYQANKLTAQRSGGQGPTGQNAVRQMIALRLAAQKTLGLLSSDFQMTFADLIREPALMIWLLVPKNADELGRFKVTLHPQNIRAMEDLVGEIQSGLTTLELLKRENDPVLWYALVGAEGRAYEDRAEKAAQASNASLTYFRYKASLDQAGTAFLPKREKKQGPQGMAQALDAAPAKGFLKGLLGR
ncbi:MAG: hypothetical protein WDA02_02325 [Saccharofermentanales bacterium]